MIGLLMVGWREGHPIQLNFIPVNLPTHVK